MLGAGSAIVGVGITDLGPQLGRSAVDLQTEAILLALDDAGLTNADVDAVFSLGAYSSPSMMFAMTLCEYAGLRPAVQAAVDAGGGFTTMMMLNNAIWAVESRQAEVAVCVFGEPAATGRRQAGRGWTSTAESNEFEAPVGIAGPVVSYALLASRYMKEFGTTVDDLGAIAVAHREHAMRHPKAVRRETLTISQYHKSRLIATPLRLLDCSSIVDGAGAVVVTSTDRAAGLRPPPVSVLSVASRTMSKDVLTFPGFAELQVGRLAQKALADAGLTLPDVDVALIYDAFTISVVFYLEELGFCGRGEAGDYARAGGLSLGSTCPVNTHGGLLSQGHVAGMLHLVEAVEQLRGEADDRQVRDCETAMLVGGGGMLGVNAVMLLGRA